MRQLRFAHRARVEIDELYLYGIQMFGPRQADGYAAALRGKIDLLASQPFIGALRPEVRPPVRLMRYEAHNVFYDVTDDVVIIVRVLHHSADWIHNL